MQATTPPAWRGRWPLALAFGLASCGGDGGTGMVVPSRRVAAAALAAMVGSDRSGDHQDGGSQPDNEARGKVVPTVWKHDRIRNSQ